jgi:hypothetical protein
MEKQRVLSLSAALSAFAVPGLVPADAAASVDTTLSSHPLSAARPTIQLPVGTDLMAFTVGETADGMVVAAHSSHSSHASHASHTSSSSPGHASHASHHSHYSGR